MALAELSRDLKLEKASAARGVYSEPVDNETGEPGLAGANMLGLRATEGGAFLSQRGKGSLQERKAALAESLNCSDELTANMTIDDTWDDETFHDGHMIPLWHMIRLELSSR